MARKPVGRLLVLPVLASVLVAGSCARSEFRYVAHSSTNTYLKVPREWKAYDGRLLDQLEAKAEEFGGEQGPSFVDQAFQGEIQWRVAYDGDEDPEPRHVVSFADAPVVEVRVRELNEAERDQVNLASLRNIFFPYDQLKAQLEVELEAQPLEANPATGGSFRPLLENELNLDGGIRGNRIRFEVREGDQFYVIDQTALLNSRTNHVHVLLMRASEEQFVTHRKLLDEIAGSFTVKEKD
jgi:hypothetical protein